MMACSSAEIQRSNIFEDIKSFPPVIDGRINLIKFLEATSDLLCIVDCIGKAFAPVKYDMQGNVDKIKKHYSYDDDSCILQLMLEETKSGKNTAAEGVLWLNRALLFFELVFKEILIRIQSNSYDESMKKIFTLAYEGSVKKYHSWVTQQLFTLICKMSPTLPQIMKSLEIEHDIKGFETKLTNFNVTLHLVRCKIDDFFKDNNLFEEPL